MNWMRETSEGVVVNIRVVPRASRNEIAGVAGDALRIRLQAPPVEGKANKALIEFLASRLDASRASLVLLRGERGRAKQLLIRGLSPAALSARLGLGMP
jgi:uncharacterized protein